MIFLKRHNSIFFYKNRFNKLNKRLILINRRVEIFKLKYIQKYL